MGNNENNEYIIMSDDIGVYDVSQLSEETLEHYLDLTGETLEEFCTTAT